MRKAKRTILILCPYFESLLEYLVILRSLDIPHVNFCTDFVDMKEALKEHSYYDLLIYDGAPPDTRTLDVLRWFSRKNCFRQLILAGNFSSIDSHSLLHWAWTHQVPLIQLLSKPLTSAALQDALNNFVFYEHDPTDPQD